VLNEKVVLFESIDQHCNAGSSVSTNVTHSSALALFHNPLTSNSLVSLTKPRPPTKALYSISDQLEDLRHKEMELERAKLEFFKKAEEHRF
jgi:hypothetical protein